MLNLHHVDVADLPATLPSLDEESQSVSTDDTASFVQACDAERFGTWAFCTLVRGIEWDPAVFTRIVGECEPKLKVTLESASIFTFACRRSRRRDLMVAECVSDAGYNRGAVGKPDSVL